MAVTSATITRTTADVFLPEVWSNKVLSAVEFSAQMQKRVNREYEGEITKAGDYVRVPLMSNLTTSTKSSGLANVVAFEAITELAEAITVTTHEYAAFMVEDIIKIQSNVNLKNKYSSKIGYALSRGREVTLTALVASLSQTVGTLAVELTSDNVRAAWLYLAQAGLLENSPDPGEDFSVFVSPAVYADWLNVDEFIRRDYNPSADAIGRAHLGDIYGFKVFLSNLLTSNTGGHDNVMFHKDCFALAVQKEIPVESAHIIESLADAVVGHNIYGTDELNHQLEAPGTASKGDQYGVWLKGK